MIDNITLILFVACVLGAGMVAARAKNWYWCVFLMVMLAVLGVYELFCKAKTGLTLSQMQDGFSSGTHLWFTILLFGGLAALFVHLNWKRWRVK